ncbi:hypothetical protein LINGRAHAP2_LOCUS5306, partial [Linum grandiflorum]
KKAIFHLSLILHLGCRSNLPFLGFTQAQPTFPFHLFSNKDCNFWFLHNRKPNPERLKPISLFSSLKIMDDSSSSRHSSPPDDDDGSRGNGELVSPRKEVKFSDEESLVIRMYNLVGERTPGRTAQDVEKYWNSRRKEEEDTPQGKKA